MELAARGLTNAQIADQLTVTSHAIKLHLSSVYRKLGVGNRTEAAVTYLTLQHARQLRWTFASSSPCCGASKTSSSVASFSRFCSLYCRYGTPGMVNGKPGIVARGTESWESQTELIITQGSDPYGRAAQQYTGGSPKTGTPAVPVGEQAYMASLAPIYAAVANGNAIHDEILKSDPVDGAFNATAVVDSVTDAALPFVQFTATGQTSTSVVRLAQKAALVLQTYVANEEKAAGIAPSDRVVLQLIENGDQATLVKGHSKSVPLLVFVAILGAAVALAFVKENADPRTAAALGRRAGKPTHPMGDPAMAGMEAPRPSMAATAPAQAERLVWLDDVESAGKVPALPPPSPASNGHAASHANMASSLIKARRWNSRDQTDTAS